MADRPVYIIKLKPESYVSDPIKALRAALKRLLRSYGLKCVGIAQTDKDAAP
jgi:hypothetical protein